MRIDDMLTARPGSLMRVAADRRDRLFGSRISYSRKAFAPLTQLCRDSCHYCTFATTPRALPSPYLSLDEILKLARAGQHAGCKELLFTLGDRPEARFDTARRWLGQRGYQRTVEYLRDAAALTVRETGLLPHINAGILDADDYAMLRPFAASFGLMLESLSLRLCEKGGPHFGSPDKNPAVRLAAIAAAGEAAVPFTTGILVGIGETRAERIEALIAIRDLHRRYGHIQEVIVQNFRAKAGTRMAEAPEPPLSEFCWTIAAARLILDDEVSIQAPPNLSANHLEKLVAAGINDWGGVSPVTPDHVNPEAPWPALARLAGETARAGKQLVERLTIYPSFLADRQRWLDHRLEGAALKLSDTAGLARNGSWAAGGATPPRRADTAETGAATSSCRPSSGILSLLDDLAAGAPVAEDRLAAMFEARGADCQAIIAAADRLRQRRTGDTVTYVVNRNINYTNICAYRCAFCAFSKGKTAETLRGKPYLLDTQEVGERVAEAWAHGATEVCMQGGIHPQFDGRTYLAICAAAKQAAPDIHIHAFSPLEILHGATTLGMPIRAYLAELKAAGLASLPGTAAEILSDDVRAVLCPDKLTTTQWINVLRAAHEVGLPTTSTIMFGHLETYIHWARHLRIIRDLQLETGGITEFVPLPFVHMEAPVYLRGRARKGPTWRETLLMHAVARLFLGGAIDNIQASWVKLGPKGAGALLAAGVNDLGGTLMNESISRAAGAVHGQEFTGGHMEALIRSGNRVPRQRSTLYGDPAGRQAPERARAIV